MNKRLFFIFNPLAGKGHIRSRLFGIVEVMASADYEITIYPTKGKQDAVKKIESLPEGYDLVVCSGGDGTLDEVVTGMMRRDRRIPIGYIPAGTCNDFARSLKIPMDMAKAAKIAVNGSRFSCDIGSFGDKNFVYIAAFGIFTEVSYSTPQDVKNALGHMAYLLKGIQSLTGIRSYRMKVTSREKCFQGDFLYGMITNSKSVGGFKSIVGKHVLFDDGEYEVTFIKRPASWSELQEILAAILIEEIDSKYMISFRSSKLLIEAEEDVPWTLDGEFGGEHRTVEICNNRQAVEMIIQEDWRQSISLGEGKNIP